VPAEIQNGMWSERAINADDIAVTYDDIATGKVQIRRFQRPHPSLNTLLQETPLNISKYGSIFVHVCAVGSKTGIFSEPDSVLAVQGHPLSMILVPIKSAYMRLPISWSL